MFKRFSVDENIASHSQVKSSQQRAIRSSILTQYPEVEPYLEQLLPKKAPMIVAKWYTKRSIRISVIIVYI